MKMDCQSNHNNAFQIESYGNGLFYEIVRISDGASEFLQCEDAVRLSQELEQTSERCTDDDVVWQYF